MILKDTILSLLNTHESIRAAEIVSATGLSRATVHLALKELQDEGKIALLGKANTSRYIRATKENLARVTSGHLSFKRIFSNNHLEEDAVFQLIEKETSIVTDLPKNVIDILYYAFTEMLNNAIDHSQSQTVEVSMKRQSDTIFFEITDRGIGIFNNIQYSKNLDRVSDAIEDLLKGKQTTLPERHSGEGIFFTSKAGDSFSIKSSGKKLLFDNILPDVFIMESRVTVGTKVSFSISVRTPKTLPEIFSPYTSDTFEFDRTQIRVKLHKDGVRLISRSQARRILSSLDTFKELILDFSGVETVGQGFADEIFRVWQNNHPGVTITSTNVNENVHFMINHAKNTRLVS
jgi:anti-sigma regulatory factor (Ser/Thr protein kinase)